MNYERDMKNKQVLSGIKGVSYIGAPKPYTAMFITKKIERLIFKLNSVHDCVIFSENGISVPESILENNLFVFSNNPQLEYADFANSFNEKRFEEERKLKYILMPSGYYLCEDSDVGENAYIEPGCLIGPDVHIGKNAKIFAGSVIKHSRIGNNFLANEYSIIGANGFTMTEDEAGNKVRIPTLGKVVIGNNVEVGTHNNISCGSGGDTVIDDYVKLDTMVCIGHDVHLHKNVEITAGAIIGGFDEIFEHAYVGINAVLRNRIIVGENALIGMGSTVTKSVEANTVVAGNPARIFSKR